MLLKLLLAFLYGVHTLATEASTTSQTGSPPPLLLISFDGFRADYLQRFPMPNLERLYSQGVLVEQLTNVFVTKTFPNHFTMVGVGAVKCNRYSYTAGEKRVSTVTFSSNFKYLKVMGFFLFMIDILSPCILVFLAAHSQHNTAAR